MTDESYSLTVTVLERVCSVLSLCGCLFIIATFSLSSAFHKPINRLIFYASFGNVLCNVATLMSRSFVDQPNSAGCQLQGFLIQMLMPADVLWALAMAGNVYLVFYHRYDISRLRKLEPFYLILCYGIPFIPALTYLFLKNDDGVRAYGNASIWCWISKEWSIWRISTFYGPVWLVILVCFFIYIRAGVTILQWKSQISDLSRHEPDRTTQVAAGAENTKVTEIAVSTIETTSLRDSITFGVPAMPPPSHTVEISAQRDPKRHRSFTEDIPIAGRSINSSVSTDGAAAAARRSAGQTLSRSSNNAILSYANCSMLFFAAMLITWIPSSANRVYNKVHDDPSVPLEIMSAFVLPLQGFWNTLIYISTSWTACRGIVMDLGWGSATEILGRSEGSEAARRSHHTLSTLRKSSRRIERQQDTESTETLAISGGASLQRT